VLGRQVSARLFLLSLTLSVFTPLSTTDLPRNSLTLHVAVDRSPYLDFLSPQYVSDRFYVTSSCFQDFYLQSHNGIKGTARPAHYFMLENEMCLTEGQIHTFVSRLPFPLVNNEYLHMNDTINTEPKDSSALSHLRPGHHGCVVCSASVLCGPVGRTWPVRIAKLFSHP
jgi:hypothetical protein